MMRRVAFALCFVACGGGASAPKDPSGPASSEASAAPEAPRKPPAGPPTALDCGDFTTCAIASGGEARCWGRDKTGELGDGGGNDRPRDVGIPGLGKVTAIAMASQFGCALGDDKKVSCWGTGMIANDGKKVDKAKATPVAGVDGALELVASGVIACARTASGVTCWGSAASTIGEAPKGTFKQVAAGFTHACALDEKGAPLCWGTGDWGPKGAYAKPAGLAGASYIATGDRHACVVGKDKKVWCWGQNDAGQLGTKSDTNAHPKPTPVPGIANAVKLAAGEASMCALMADGTAKCWGEKVATGVTSDLADICIATQHACALTKSSSIRCWGENAHGQLGDGSKEKHSEPVTVDW